MNITVRCVLCGKYFLSEKSRVPLCTSCGHKLVPVQGMLCCRCGRPLISEKKICMECREREFMFSENKSVFEYAGRAKRILLEYKFTGNKYLAPFFAQQFNRILETLPDFDAVIPVPGNPETVKKRGWDQVETIADILARRYKYSVYKLLKRRPAEEQKTLGFASRMKNLRGKIAIKKEVEMTGTAVLIDDVFTTGATGNECAETLLRSGLCSEVKLVTFAVD